MPVPPVPHTRYFKELVVVAERAAFKVRTRETIETEEKSTCCRRAGGGTQEGEVPQSVGESVVTP